MRTSWSRPNFFALAAAAPAALSASGKKIPFGLELYSVRAELAKDLSGAVRAVAKMGYTVVSSTIHPSARRSGKSIFAPGIAITRTTSQGLH
jgi:hypothetical protein